ncbi:MAG: exodeoxyribonuclease I [Gammaproteobacteria bacterium HGW-Gammaproteobacteria-3]|nr:MAG: exodeoxyribonuclease I [Gammaproteobacteria bacterium HGW-Gammaproteobacteria-3]
MTTSTLYWHDYETFGTDPARDRPVQFAGVRTDLDLRTVGEPLNIYCRPALDTLPQPEACLVTGITPQLAEAKGVCEAEFIGIIQEQMAQPNTCVLGYNSLRFDDEVTRNTLYRNLRDPYQREWQNGNSRWDLLDVLRAAWALRPEGIEWPLDNEGVPVFRLELLTEANALEHESAHDALADVYATIAMARLLKTAQPKLYRFLFEHRTKAAAGDLLQLGKGAPVVHISGKYPARKNCLAVVLPICRHPTNSNGIIVYDLSVDPEALLSLSAEDIRQRIFTPSAQLPQGVERVPLKTVHVNKCPVLAPIKVIRPQDAARLQLDLEACCRHIERIMAVPELTAKITQVFNADYSRQETDPDLMIYSGGFFNDRDKQLMAKIQCTTPERLAHMSFDFNDARLPEMLFRYRARNYPETLTAEEQIRWREDCRRRLTQPEAGSAQVLGDFVEKLHALRADASADQTIVSALQQFADEKMRQLSISL